MTVNHSKIHSRNSILLPHDSKKFASVILQAAFLPLDHSANHTRIASALPVRAPRLARLSHAHRRLTSGSRIERKRRQRTQKRPL